MFYIELYIKMTATILIEGMYYIITIIRNGEEKKFKFLHDTIVLCTKEENKISSYERQKIKGPAHDGILNFIYAESQADIPEMYIWITKDELWTIYEIVNQNEESDISFSDEDIDYISSNA